MTTPLLAPQQNVLQKRTLIKPIIRAVATYGTTVEELTVVGGSVTVDRRRSQWTTADMAVEVKGDVPGILTPLGTEINITAGITLPNGTESVVPLGTRLQVTSVDGIVRNGATLSLQMTEVSERVARWRFERPLNITAPIDLAQVVNLVMNNRGLPSTLTPIGVILLADRVFGLDPNKDPWAETQDLVDNFGWQLYINRQGQPALTQPLPNATPTDVLVLSPNINLANRPPNVISGRWEPQDGTPVYAIAEDDNPASPTFVGGPYGRVTRYFASTFPVSQLGADQAVQTLLANERYQGASWAWELPWDPTIDPYDTLNATNQTLPIVQVDSTKLDFLGNLTIDARELPQ